jgi:choline dehydrogenase
VILPQGALNQSVHYARGKTLGGSSARNIMTYHAGTEGSYKAWADAVGDPSYEFDKFWPYFMKHMNHTPPDYSKRFANTTVDYNASRLGTDGPVSVIYPNFAGAFGTYAQLAMDEVGISPIDGFESGKLIGSAYALGTIDPIANTRDSSETAYLQPALHQNNKLVVYPSTIAKNIVFDSNRRATGIKMDTMGLSYTISAKNEVILSAGSFQSPQLLMVSGVGPADKLAEHDIPVISDLPGVGQNMWDHVLFGPGHRVDLITASSIGNPAVLAEAVDQFNNEGTGLLTNPGVDVFGWEKVPEHLTSNFSETAHKDLASFPEDWPDIEYIFPGAIFGYCRNFVRDQPTDGYNYGSIIAALVAPMSRGTVDIVSADMADHPLIDPKWLTHPTDQAVAIAAFKRARAIWAAPSLSQVTIGPEYFPGLEVQSDEEILDLIREALTPVSHAACTCKMGQEADPMAVVDPKARVYGVEALRVVDASSFALLPPGHPMATVCELRRALCL